MRALVLDQPSTATPSTSGAAAPGSLRARLVSDRAAPVPAPGEALVQMLAAPVCDVDLELACGTGAAALPTFAGVLGQQGLGTVLEVTLPKGSAPALEAKRALKGKRVMAGAWVACGTCPLCKGGLSSHCRARVGVGAGRDGWLAETVALPLSILHAVPERLDADAAALAHLVGAAVHAAHLLRIEGKPYITVLGDGPLGLCTAQVMSRLNASVRLLGKHADRLALCDRWGIKHRLESEVGRRADQDVVVECTGAPEGLALAMRLVRPRGKIILKSTATRLPIALDQLAVPARAVPVAGAGMGAGGGGGGAGGVDLSALVVNEIELMGCREGSIEQGLAALARNEVSVSGLVSTRFKLGHALAALEAAKAGGLRVLVERG